MSKVQHWQISDEFIATCDRNVDVVREVYNFKKPIQLQPFKNFEPFAESWWDEFYSNTDNAIDKFCDLSDGRIKFNYSTNSNISVLDSLSEHLFSKIFSEHKIVCWLTSEDKDYGTDWHQDLYPNNNPKNYQCPSYLICMNLVGETHWQFEGFDDIHMKPGDILCQNGSVPHKVLPIDNNPRITIAGHNGLDFVIL